MQNRKKVLLCVLIACALLVVGGIVLINTEAGRELLGVAKATNTPNPKLVIDPNAGPSPTPSPTVPGIAIPGWAGLSMPAGVTEADVPLYNPDANADWYYLTFELQLKETGEVLFSTGLIPPDLYCNKVTLSRPLEIGTYECTMIVQPYFIREVPTPTNNAVFDIQLSVF